MTRPMTHSVTPVSPVFLCPHFNMGGLGAGVILSFYPLLGVPATSAVAKSVTGPKEPQPPLKYSGGVRV